jgi:flagellar motor protein MotB
LKVSIRKRKLNVLFCASAAILLVGLTYAAANQTRQLAAGDKARVTGSILSRDGDLVRVRDKKSGEVVVVNITDSTTITRMKHCVLVPRHTDIDRTAMVPGLTIEAEGVGNSKGQLDARIFYNQDEVAVEVAQEQQVLANQVAVQNAQSTTEQGIAAAGQAQSSAAQASNTLGREMDRKLREEPDAAVARYLRETKDLPMRRILVPIGDGTTYPVVGNKNPRGRELDRRIDIKVLMNNGLGQALWVATQPFAAAQVDRSSDWTRTCDELRGGKPYGDNCDRRCRSGSTTRRASHRFD